MPDWSYQPAFKPLLFRLPAEEARRLTLRLLEIQSRTETGRRLFALMGHAHPPESTAVCAFGLRFPSPVGLGPGIDISGVSLAAMQYLGFGFLTIGPVGDTTVARTSGTEPLRLENEHCLVMSPLAGGPDAASLASHVAALPDLHVPVGMALRGHNIGAAIRAAANIASYFTLPTSCANDLSFLPELRASTARPLLLRLSPDWSRSRLDRVLDAAMETGMDGFVAVSGVCCLLLPEGEMDGPFLRDRALETVAYVTARCGSPFPVVGAGGIMTPADAAAFLQAGACMVELYSGLVYAGPGLPKRVFDHWGRQQKLSPGSHSNDIHTPIHSGNGAAAVGIAPRSLPTGAAIQGDAPVNRPHRAQTAPDHSPVISQIRKDANLFSAIRRILHPHFVFSRDAWLFVMLTGLVLILSGIGALIMAATIKLMPYDFAYLGMSADELCSHHACRIVHFMVHDRVSFGGSIMAIGIVYLWLGAAPLRRGEAWAWWTLVLSGAIGYASFLTYLGYGYLDIWHAWATLALLVVFVVGMIGSYRGLKGPRGPSSLLRRGAEAWIWSPAGMGRALLSFSALGMIAGGLVIMYVGMTHVFVPQDLEFMQISIGDLRAINPRLIPLIAHDRAGFGGGLCSGGIAIFLTLWCGLRPGERALWLALCLAGLIGFGTAIAIHPLVGYTNFMHLLPAYLGALSFVVGIRLLYRPLCWRARGGSRFSDL